MPYGALVESRLRVLSWNLWGRFGPWEARQPAILATIAALDPDVACLQEAWSAPESSMAALVGERLGFHHVHSCNDDGPVHSGNTIVSRWPILRTSWRPLPAGGAPDERRTVLFAEIDGPRGAIQVFCTHLNWRFDHSEVRQEQVRLIGAFIDECRPRDYPPILAGDMNAAPDSDEIRILTGRTTSRRPEARVPRRVGGGRRRPGHDVVERQPVRGARPRAGAPHRLRVRGLAQATAAAAMWSSGGRWAATRSTASCPPTTTAWSPSCATESGSIAPISSRMRGGGRCCSVIVTPNGASASSMAFTSVGGDTIIPPSPTPRKLTSGSSGTVSRWWISMRGISVAVGSR